MKLTSIILKEVNKSFCVLGASQKLFIRVNATFQKGKKYGISGISGSGKSTLLNLIAGLEQPSGGTLEYRHNETKLPVIAFEQMRQKSFGIVFQNAHLIYQLSVRENVALKGFLAGLQRENAYHETDELLVKLGLEDKKNDFPATLSGGQQQRVALARALISRPDFLLADEPTSALDVQTGSEIISLFLEYQRTFGMGLIISCHDQHILTHMDEVLEINNGTLHVQKKDTK